jgi:hypothetical protein
MKAKIEKARELRRQQVHAANEAANRAPNAAT